jgi:FAD/FMN-containing dehydrogenase/Fe-S oxidoreductase
MNRIELPTADPRDIHDALTEALSGEVRFDRLHQALYATDASVYQIMPMGVVLPKTEQDIVETLAICARHGVPLTARGGGTSQAGQCIGPGVVIDFSKHFDQIIEVNAEEKWARVEPGVVLDDLNRRVKPLGLQFAPDISTSNRATIGGMVANNSSGTHSVIHGKTIDHVLGLRVALSDGSIVTTGPLSEAEVAERCRQADLEGTCYRTVRRLAELHAGEIERRFPKILRRVGGYNLDRFVSRGTGGSPVAAEVKAGSFDNDSFNLSDIFVGSEGTLGITLQAMVRLIDLPKARGLIVLHFAELLDALEATPRILRHGPAAVEVIDRFILDSTRLNPEASRLRDFLVGDPGAILLVEFYADEPDQLPAKLDALEADLREHGTPGPMVRALDPVQQERIWKLRKLALGLSMAEKGDAKAISFVEDTAVAPERLRDYIAEFLQKIHALGTTAGVYAHASVGCLHVRPVINLKTVEGIRQFETLADQVAELVLKYGGALSGEHGDGLVRSPFMEKMFGPVLYQAFRELKRAFDPKNVLNPGKIVDAPPLSGQLRFGAEYVTAEVPTVFDFTADGGLARATELCAGIGECRKKRQGDMCPSYQATRDEQHSTRGRANVLRLALSGQLTTRRAGDASPPVIGNITDPAVKEVLDLCLECKACKSECPTNVDMARLKAEFLHHYYRKHGLPWRNWIFGNVGRWYRRGSKFPGLFNWLTRGRVGRWFNEKLFGIDRRRMPPALARMSWMSARSASKLTVENDGSSVEEPSLPHRGKVLLFPDTFMNYCEPDLGRHMREFLAHLQCDVEIDCPDLEYLDPQLTCCGRPYISNGMLDQAVAAARHNVERLYPWAAEGRPIIACEPSCILTIKDDYPALLHQGEWRDKAACVARACRTFEEFAEEAWQKTASPLLAQAARLPKRILVQAHCHQRSLVGVEPLLRLLRRIPGAEVIDLDGGCCGLAGSFGYEKEHYEISRLVGEQRLFPALRKMEPGSVVVAPGFSCRMQISHFTGIRAVHPVQLLNELFVQRNA